MVSYTQLMTRFREKHRVLIILVPGPAKLYSIAFNPHRWSVLAATNGVLEHLIEGEGDLRARTALTHLYRKLIVNVCCPVKALSVLWIDQALVAIRRHHNNSVVAHSQVLDKKIYFDSILITNITLVFSYLVYYTADHLTIYGNRFSGIISVLTFGIYI